MGNILTGLYGNPNQSVEQTPTLGSTYGAAFRQENDVVNLYDALRRPEFRSDPDFDYRKPFRELEVPVEFVEKFAATKSEPEFMALLARIQQEEKDKATLASSGWTGTVAALSAGVLSPTMFIPFTAGGRGLRLIGQAAMLSGAAATASEAALFYNQETRETAEGVASIAMATLLGGALGSAFVGLGRVGRARLVRDMTYGQRFKDVPVELSDTGTVRIVRVKDDPFELARRSPGLALHGKTPDMDIPIPVLERVVADLPQIQQMDEVTAQTYFSAVVSAPLAKLAREQNVSAKDLLLDIADGFEAKLYETRGKVTEETFPKEERVRLAERVEDTPESGRVLDEIEPELEGKSKQSLSADAVVAARNTQGVMRPKNVVRNTSLNLGGKMNPWFSMAESPFASLRDAAPKLDNAGLRQAGLETSEPSAVGGTVLSRRNTHEVAIADLYDALDTDFYAYLYDGKQLTNKLSAVLAQVKSSINLLPPGKMSWKEFNNEVYVSWVSGKKFPEGANSVAAFGKFFQRFNDTMKDYHKELLARGVDVPPLYKELLEENFEPGAQAYAHETYSRGKLSDKIDEFMDDYTRVYEDDLNRRFNASKEKFDKKRQDMEQLRQFVAMDQQGKQNAFDAVELQISSVDETLEPFYSRRQAVRKQAKEEGWDKERTKDALKSVDEGATDDEKALLGLRNGLAKQRLAMRREGGNASARIQKLEADKQALWDRTLKSVKTFTNKLNKVNWSVERTDAQLAKSVASAEASVGKLLDQMGEAYNKFYLLAGADKTFGTPITEAAEQRAKSIRVKYEGMQARLEALRSPDTPLREKLAGLASLRDELYEDITKRTLAQGARLERLEAKLAEQKGMVLSPKEQAERLKALDEELERFADDFDASWRDKGAVGDDLTSGPVSFREQARGLALELYQTLTGSIDAPAYFKVRQKERGPELARALHTPFDIKQKYLETDTEFVARAYIRQMAPDLELWRALDGSVNGANVIADMQQELTALLTQLHNAKAVKFPSWWKKPLQKTNERFGLDNFSQSVGDGYVPITPEVRAEITKYFSEEFNEQARNFDIAIQRIRHTRMVPEHAAGAMYRTGAALKMLNVPLLMGKVVVSSIPDLGRTISKYGIEHTVGKAWLPYIGNIKGSAGGKFRVRAKETARQLGLNMEVANHSRAKVLFDIGDEYATGKSKLERGIRALSYKTGLIAMYDFWNDMAKTVASTATHATMSVYVPNVSRAIRAGAPIEGELLEMRTYLRNLGLRDSDILRIGTEMERPGGMESFSNGASLPNLEQWKDAEAFRAYAGALTTDVNQMVITPGLERPNWSDQNIAYSLVSQFKSYSFSATSKIMMSGVQGNEPYLVQGALFSLALGAVSYYLNAVSNGGKALERANELDPVDWIYESLDRSGLTGVLSWGQQMGEQVPALNQFWLFGGEDKPYRRPVGLLGAMFGPTAGSFEKATEFLKNVDNTQNPAVVRRNMKILRQLFVPYQNHFLLKRAFDAVGDGMQQVAGVAQ